MSDDELWTDVIHQVLSALDEANVADPSTREALTAGVRSALESLETDIGIDVQIIGDESVISESRTPTVEVVTGGRAANEPPSTGDKPELRIAAPESPPDKDSSASTPPERPLFTHVHVNRPTHRTVPPQSLSTGGWIRVGGGDDAPAHWQAIYLGATPRLYRIGCTMGILDVTVEGEPVERLMEGQSIDVEGVAIRVTTERGGAAEGQYVCMLHGGLEE